MRTCNTCEEIKDISEFSGSNKKCKKCFCAYVTNKHKTEGRSYQNAKAELKKDQKCDTCGINEFLEFDHLDRDQKTITIGRSQSAAKIREESEKCRFLCIWCHRLHTKQHNKEESQIKWEAVQYAAEALPEDDDGTQCNGIFCEGKYRSDDMFFKKRGKPSGDCKYCRNYEDHCRRQRISNYINRKKREIGKCQLCEKIVKKGTEVCFDFDHIDPSTKVCSVSHFTKLALRKFDRVNTEIAKCRLLCCYCHFTHTNSVKVYHKKRESSTSEQTDETEN